MTRIALPRLPLPESLNEPGKSILTIDGRALVIYDTPTQSGFVYVVDLGRWNITSPITFLDFAALLPQLGVCLPANESTRAWIDVCSASHRSKAH
ncbi:hypothetical protein [Xanthomonas citri]|uniref:hypothetical protein n=1 Tax=Xanthomonas citri TaxID=346 RepID=UPI0005B4CA4D